MKTIIAVPDFTRKAHLKKILPGLLENLQGDVEIIIATGLHRAPTKKEIKHSLSFPRKRESIFLDSCLRRNDKNRISVHNYRRNYVAYFGKTKAGIPIYLNKILKNADSIITVGVVEPHLYAGYSGGAKVVAIGLAGEETINATHHPRFLDHPGTKLCSISGNPFRDFIEEASSLLPIKYSINIVNDRNGNLSKVFKGEPKSSFKKAVKYAQKMFEKKINKKFDVVICDMPKEKAVNIYQASRAFNYVVNTRKTVLKPNGIILVKAALKEGFGKGLGEKRFMEKIVRMKCPKKLIADIKKKGCLAGEHRAYMVAKAMSKARLGFISRKEICLLLRSKGKFPFLFLKDLKEAQVYVKNLKKDPKIYYLKNAFNTILTH